MKDFFYRLADKAIPLTCFILAGILALYKIDYWGWFLVVGVLTL